MASSSWQEIYESYSASELAAEIAALKKRNTGFSAQGSPSGKSYQADLNELREQLAAAIRVQANRGSGAVGRVGLVDFSGMAANAGTGIEPGRRF